MYIFLALEFLKISTFVLYPPKSIAQLTNACHQGHDKSRNMSSFECKKVRCECIKDRFLCGKDGTIDLSDQFAPPAADMPEDPDDPHVMGPGSVKCERSPGNATYDCNFEGNGVFDDLTSSNQI